VGCSKPGTGIDCVAKHTQQLREPVSSAVIFAVQKPQKPRTCGSIPLPSGAICIFQDIQPRLNTAGFPGREHEPEINLDVVNELECLLIDKHGLAPP
jgi:hypothetical protein